MVKFNNLRFVTVNETTSSPKIRTGFRAYFDKYEIVNTCIHVLLRKMHQVMNLITDRRRKNKDNVSNTKFDSNE